MLRQEEDIEIGQEEAEESTVKESVVSSYILPILAATVLTFGGVWILARGMK